MKLLLLVLSAISSAACFEKDPFLEEMMQGLDKSGLTQFDCDYHAPYVTALDSASDTVATLEEGAVDCNYLSADHSTPAKWASLSVEAIDCDYLREDYPFTATAGKSTGRTLNTLKTMGIYAIRSEGIIGDVMDITICEPNEDAQFSKARGRDEL